MATAGTLFLPTQRPGSGFFVDHDGVISRYKHRDDIFKLDIDWSDILASAESVSSIAYEVSGPTLSNQSLSSNTSSTDVTGLGGVDITATTDASRTLTHRVRFYDAVGGRSLVDDYGN